MHSFRVAVFILLALLVCSCAMGPDYRRPEVDLPETWQEGKETSERNGLAKDWWTGFGNEFLDHLVLTALENNYELAYAQAAIEEAAAYMRIARAGLLPRINLQSENTRYTGTGDSRQFKSFTLQGELSYDPDLWGANRRTHEQAEAEMLAIMASYFSVEQRLAAQVCKVYFNFLSVNKQLEISLDTLEARQTAEEMQRILYEASVIGEYDYRQSQLQTNVALAEVQRLEMQLEQIRHALAALMGHTPKAIQDTSLFVYDPTAFEALFVLVEIPADLPSELLERRPDIIEAEKKLHAATASIGIAKAAFFPSVSLSGLVSYLSDDLANIINSDHRRWSVSGNIFQSVFEGGRLLAKLDAANAKERQAYLNYQIVVQNAFVEVFDCLILNEKMKERILTLERQVALLQEASRLAKIRYDYGQTGYLEVLDAERSLFEMRITLVRAQQSHLELMVDLLIALGGGWHEDALESG